VSSLHTLFGEREILDMLLFLYGKPCKQQTSGAVSACSAGVAIERVVACQSSTANLELSAWSCVFCSTGLASAADSDKQQNHCVHPSVGERQRTYCKFLKPYKAA